MILLASVLIVTLAISRSRSSALGAIGWVTKTRGNFSTCAHRSHRTTPATPSTAHCAPSGMARVASSTPSTIGMPRSRASEARCEVEPPSSATTPRHASRMWRERGTRHSGDQDVAGRDARQFAFAIDHDGAAGAPADAGRMAVQPGMPQPNLVRHDRRSTCSGRDCRSLKPPSSIAHSISTGTPAVVPLCAAAGRASPPRRRRGRLAHEIFRHQLGRRDAVRAGVAMILAAGLDRAQEATSASTMRSGTTSPCAMAEPRPQVARNQHLAFGGFAQAAARGSAPRPAAGSARPSRCRPATGHDCPCSGARARSTAPPSRRAPRSRIRFRR